MFRKASVFLLPFLALFFLAGCSPAKNTSPSQGGTNKPAQESQKRPEEKGITALAAWKKVKEEAKKWDGQAQLVSIKDASYASFQRQDGKANVWKFVLDQCRGKNEMLHSCNKGKSRTYFYSTTTGGWGPAGVSAQPEGPSSYAPPINLTKVKIDTDRAVELAREKKGQERNPYEEFIIQSFVTKDGTLYWEVVRQCWRKRPKKEACQSKNGYTVYVNASTGEVLEKKPREKH